MKNKLPPLVLPVRHQTERGLHTHHDHRLHAAARKAPVKHNEVDKAPRSTEESKADGQLFKDALFSTTASGDPALAMGGFGEGGGNGQGQGQQSNGDESGGRGRRGGSSGVKNAKAASDAVVSAQGASAAEAAGIAAEIASGWMDLEIESKVAGKICLSVLREPGSLRARLTVGHPLARQWMAEHLKTVEQELAAEVGCRVRLELV